MKKNLKYAFKNIWKISNAWGMLPCAIIYILMNMCLKNCFALHTIWSLFSGIIVVIIWFVAVFIWNLIRAPLAIENEKLLKNRNITKNLDDDDLRLLLNGFIIENTFTYKNEITICNPWKYEGKYEIEKLKNNWTEILVPAPKNSLAKIKFQLSNGHPQGKLYFYILNGIKEPILIDIYLDNRILLDSKSSFSFKLMYDEAYEIDKIASLRIMVESWTK